MTIWAINESTTPLGLIAEFLSYKWLREQHLEVFASYLAFRTKGSVGTWWIGGLAFPTLISALPPVPRQTAGGGGGGLRDFQKVFTTGGYKHLLFPANINVNHWIASMWTLKDGSSALVRALTPLGVSTYGPTTH